MTDRRESLQDTAMPPRWLAEEDLSCPICHNIFQDPVLMPCSHSFCKVCVEKLVQQTTSQQCPVCRRRSSDSSFPLNLALKNICEAFQQQGSGSKPTAVQDHGRPLRFARFLFCMVVIVLFLTGPKKQTWESEHHALADMNHNLNRLGLPLNSFWTLTCILTGAFTFLASFSFHRSLYISLRHLSRLAISTVVWLGLRWVSTSFEDSLGFCFEPVSSIFGFGTSQLLLLDGENKTSCLGAGFQWRGCEISQEALLLCLCCLLLMEEAAMFGQFLHSLETPFDKLIILYFYHLGVWFLLLLVFLVRLTQFPSQQLGVVVGFLVWRVLYQGWFREDPSWCCPGPSVLWRYNNFPPPLKFNN